MIYKITAGFLVSMAIICLFALCVILRMDMMDKTYFNWIAERKAICEAK